MNPPPAPPPPDPPPAPTLAETWQGTSGGTKAVIVGTAVATLGLFMSWARAPLVGSVSGLETDDGKIFAVVVGVVAVLAYARLLSGAKRAFDAWLLVVACAAVAVVLIEIVYLEGQELAIPGDGLYVSGVGAVLATLGAAANLWGPA